MPMLLLRTITTNTTTTTTVNQYKNMFISRITK